MDESGPVSKVEYVSVKTEQDSATKVDQEPANIDKVYAKLLKAGVNEHVLKNLDGGMLAKSDLSYVDNILDKKAKGQKLATGNSNAPTTNSGMFSSFYQTSMKNVTDRKLYFRKKVNIGRCM